MPASVRPTGLLRISRWRNRHLVPADHPAPERVRERVDDAIRRDVAGALADVAACASGDPHAIVFVRRLELDVAIDAGWDRAAIAGACASAFSRTLLRELADGSTDNVVRFGSEAELVAAYVATRAQGDAPLPWFLERFRGWSYLPASAAIRSALCETPEIGAAALPLLSPPALTAVALTLEARDVEAITRSISLAAPAAGRRDALRDVLVACIREPPPYHVIGRPGFVVWLAARTGGRGGWPASRAAARLAAVVQRTSAGGVPLAAALTAVAQDDRVLEAAVDEPPGVDRALRLAASVARALAGVEPPERARVRSTRFGGAFLLVDDLASIPLNVVTAHWPRPCDDASAVAALSLLTLAACLVPDRPAAFVADPVWRDLLGVPPQASGAVLLDWLDALGPARRQALARAATESGPRAAAADEAPIDTLAAAVLRRFARRLPGFAESSGPFLRRNFLDVAARLDFEPDRIAVTLTRPPLALVLGLTGRNRGDRAWPWLDPRPFVLFPEA